MTKFNRLISDKVHTERLQNQFVSYRTSFHHRIIQIQDGVTPPFEERLKRMIKKKNSSVLSSIFLDGLARKGRPAYYGVAAQRLRHETDVGQLHSSSPA